MRKQYSSQTVRRGSSEIFTEKMEADFVLYILHCNLLRVPRTREMLEADIVDYVLYNDLERAKLLMEQRPGYTF